MIRVSFGERKFEVSLRYFLTIVLGGLGFVLGVMADAKACEYPPAVRAASETRLYENAAIGFSFRLPANYRAMGMGTLSSDSGQGIFVFDPSAYTFMQCYLRNPSNAATEAPYARASVSIVPIRTSYQNLSDLLYRQYPYMRSEAADLRYTSLAGRPAVLYYYLDDVFDRINYTSLVSPDGKYFITISGPNSSSELNLLLSSFRFN
jgi:hypothetical protein